MIMNSENGAAPSGYHAEFSRLVERVEVTTPQGTRLSIDQGVDSIIAMLMTLKGEGRKALLVGNGGSAAIVSHLHNDLCKAVGLRAIVFHEAPLLTALANDNGYETVFQQPIDLWADPHDLLIAVSSSGESPNIVAAATHARDQGCRIVTFTGFQSTNRLRALGDLNVYVPALGYGYVEMAHSLLAHCITDVAIARARALN
jgi:D-sedoheptulose 7-phosphate isomerase